MIPLVAILLLSLSQSLELNSKIDLQWSIYGQQLILIYTVDESIIAENGWIGFGIQTDEENGMVGSDLFTIDTSLWTITSQHVSGSNGHPSSDSVQNLTITKSEDSGKYEIVVLRTLGTNNGFFNLLTEGTNYYAQWAHGAMTDGVQGYHSNSRGSTEFQLTSKSDSALLIGLGLLSLLLV